MSYEGAVEYCKWLTDLYNNDPKREFKRVLFSLPTEEEWMKAAYGGNVENLYPWGSHLRYKDGEDMCNMLHVVEELIVRDADGNPSESWDLNTMPEHRRRPYFALPIQYTQHIGSYKPNGYGLYNVSGNVAEMIVEKGISKGGSFNSYGGEVRIDVKGRYTETSPELGFRVFMRVVEK
jgi:formylglycine-generating enzyme